MTKRQKLELTWIGKDARPKLEPRILLEDPNKSYHAKHRVGEADLFDNRLIFGDNLLALKALEQEFTGKVKCVFIDPPYNTGSAFTHYEDGLEHSIWLGLMRDRLEVIRRLMSDDGSLWITIDDNEAHYLKVLCDEIFGRANFVANVVWQKKYSVSSDAKGIPSSHDHILVFSKTGGMTRNLLPRSEKQNDLYKYDDKDGRGPWRTDNLSVKTISQAYLYEITNPNTGVAYYPPTGRAWMTSKDRMLNLIDEHRVFFGRDGKGAPQLKRYLAEVQQGVVPTTWWPFDEVGHNDESRKEHWVVNKDYNAEMLAAVICKLEGFTYAPSDTHYWQHGHSTETDFIYVTTQTLNADQLQALSDEVGGEKSLLVCCSAFKVDAKRALSTLANLTLKKIPKMVLTKCEWGHEDYSLKVENLPMQQQSAAAPVPSKRAASANAAQTAQDGLFGGEKQV